MKSLKSRLQRIELPRYYGDRTLEEYCDVNGIDIDNITESQLHVYSYFVYTGERSHHALLNHINEMLNSHNGEELANKIMQVLDSKAFEHGIHQIDNCVIVIKIDKHSPIITKTITTDFLLNDCPESEQIYDLLDYYGYYITTVDKVHNNYLIRIEPKYTKEYDNKTGIYYHITSEKNLPNILRKGLRPHVGKARIQGGYRYFTKRLFLISDSPTVYDDIKKVINDKGYKEDEYVILRIDGDLYSGHKNKLATFIDDYSVNANDVYTYEYIPKEAISIVDLESLK